MRALRSALLTIAMSAVLTVAVLYAQEPDKRIPQVRPLPAIPAEMLRPLKGEIRTTIRGLAFTVADEFKFNFPVMQIVGDPATFANDEIHISLVHLTRPSLFSTSTGKPLVIDLFAALPGPRIVLDRLVIEDGEGGDIYPPGHVPQWFWRLHDVDFDIRNIALGGDGAEGLTIARGDFTGQFKGDPLEVTSMQASLRRGSGRLNGSTAIAMRTTRLRASGVAHQAGGYTVDVVADPLRFAEVTQFAGMLPKTGIGVIDVQVAGRPGVVDANIRRAVANVGESQVRASGRVRMGDEGVVNGFVIDVARLRSEDLDAAYGMKLPGGGEWSGAVRANGGMTSGVVVDGALRQAAESGSARIALAGTVWGEPRVAMDLRLNADPLRVADTAFVVAMRLRGPLDTLTINGDATLVGKATSDSDVVEDIAARIDARMVKEGAARVVRGDAQIHGSLRDRLTGAPRVVTADASGSLVLAKDGRVEVRAHADSIPVQALPLPAALDSARGWLHANAQVTGTLSEASVTGRLTSSDVFLVRTDSASVHAVADIRFDGVIPEATARGSVAFTTRSLDGLRITPAGVAEGSVVIADSGAIDITVRADSLPFRLIPAPSQVTDIRGGAFGTVHITGTIAEPRYDGLLHVADGGLRVPRTGTVLSGVQGPVRIDNGIVSIDSLAGEIGRGRFLLTGNATLNGDSPQMDVIATIDSGYVADTDSVSILASARLRAFGPLMSPQLEGIVDLLDGVMHEDVLKRRKPLDTEDPPYADLVARVPWVRDSRLRAAAQPDTNVSPVNARVVMNIHPAFIIVDEDSEMFGTGRIVIVADSSGAKADGIYRIEGGQYNNFGERFDVVGGSFFFDGVSMAPHVSMRAEHGHEAPIGTSIGSSGQLLDYSPPLEFFAIGGLTQFTEEVRRLAVVPERQTELGALLIYGEQSQPVTGFRTNRFWQIDDGSDVVGERGEAQSIPLLWAYTADEGYDYIPLSKGYLRAGNYTVGPRYPGRTVVGGILSGGVRMKPFEIDVSHAMEGGGLPGLRVRYDANAFRISAFNEPRFRAQPALGQLRPGHYDVRRTGLRLRWSTDGR